MVCIYCGGNTGVVNSRHQQRTNSVWRRRQCQACKAVFTSIESPDRSRSWSFHAKDGSVHSFSPEKLLISLYQSLGHRKSSVEDATALHQTVLNKLAKQTTDGLIDRVLLVKTTADILRRFDKAAATTYLAYHAL